jgi:uncharacterized membrane protein YhaH (DUF805 family)
MRRLVWFWLSTTGRVDRATYFRHGLGLTIVKYAGDAWLIHRATGRGWTPLDYLQSVEMLWGTLGGGAPWWLLPSLMAWTLPFLWIGVTLTMRRAVDAGWSPWVALGFFVPYSNYLLMAVLCLVPTAPGNVQPSERRTTSDGGASRIPAALKAIGATSVIGFLMLLLSVEFVQQYGVALFFGAPFVMGAVGSLMLNRRSSGASRDVWLVLTAAFTIVGAAVILLGREGLVCVVMALPIVVPVAILGALLADRLARSDPDRGNPAGIIFIVLPLALALEPAHATGRVVHEVQTSVVIDAPPARVWPHVIAFDPIVEPADAVFRLGIAYPKSARIAGSGAGAVRYCLFSTGAFVEPITAWEPARRLAFDVAASPPPLRELSPYDGVSPPHLDGYLRPRRGEFRLIALPGNRTRLEGSTWYELEMAPEGYWQLFSDALIHRIHRRVLDHIKHEAELDADRSAS